MEYQKFEGQWKYYGRVFNRFLKVCFLPVCSCDLRGCAHWVHTICIFFLSRNIAFSFLHVFALYQVS